MRWPWQKPEPVVLAAYTASPSKAPYHLQQLLEALDSLYMIRDKFDDVSRATKKRLTRQVARRRQLLETMGLAVPPDRAAAKQMLEGVA